MNLGNGNFGMNLGKLKLLYSKNPGKLKLRYESWKTETTVYCSKNLGKLKLWHESWKTLKLWHEYWKFENMNVTKHKSGEPLVNPNNMKDWKTENIKLLYNIEKCL